MSHLQFRVIEAGRDADTEEVITDNSWGHLEGSEVTVEAAEDH